MSLPDIEWVSAKRAAEIIGCSDRHIRNLYSRGELPGRKFGNLLRIPLGALLEEKPCDLSNTEGSGQSGTKAEESQLVSSTVKKIVKLPNGRDAKRFKTLPRMSGKR